MDKPEIMATLDTQDTNKKLPQLNKVVKRDKYILYGITDYL
jgi:hypothetical protein